MCRRLCALKKSCHGTSQMEKRGACGVTGGACGVTGGAGAAPADARLDGEVSSGDDDVSSSADEEDEEEEQEEEDDEEAAVADDGPGAAGARERGAAGHDAAGADGGGAAATCVGQGAGAAEAGVRARVGAPAALVAAADERAGAAGERLRIGVRPPCRLGNVFPGSLQAVRAPSLTRPAFEHLCSERLRGLSGSWDGAAGRAALSRSCLVRKPCARAAFEMRPGRERG